VRYVPATGQPYFVYTADDWIHCPNDDGSEGPLVNACYIWLPIQFTRDGVRINWCAEWDLDDPFAPCMSPVPAPGPVATPGCEADYSANIGDTVALADCNYELQSGHRWTFGGTFRELTWAAISETAACAKNSDGVVASSNLGKGYTLETCQAACAQRGACVAVDYFASTDQCNLYDSACEHPLQMKHNASSYRVTSTGPGSPGLLKLGGKCLASHKDAHSLDLVECSGEEGEAFHVDGDRFRRATDGACLDVRWCGDAICPGMELQAFACNSKQSNQALALDFHSGFLTSNASGRLLCATACVGQQTVFV